MELIYQTFKEIYPKGTKIEMPAGMFNYVNITSQEQIKSLSDCYKDIAQTIECDYSTHNLLLCMVDPYRIKEKEDFIFNFLNKEMRITEKSIKSRSRELKIVYARYLYFYAMRNLTDLSTTEIGTKVNRDHTTVIYGLKVVNNVLVYGNELEKKYLFRLQKEMKNWK